MLYKTHVTYSFSGNIIIFVYMQGLGVIDTYTNSIVEMYFYLIKKCINMLVFLV